MARDAADTADFADQFKISDLRKALRDNGVSQRWVIEQYCEIAKDKSLNPSARMTALERISGWIRMAAGLNPAMRKKIVQELGKRADEVVPRWSRDMRKMLGKTG